MALIECQSAREILARGAFDQGLAQSDLAEARAHVTGCAACHSSMARFVCAIESSDADEISCAEARSRLDVYRASGGEGMAIVGAHLAHCTACAAQAASWERVMALAEQGALAEPPSYPAFDLSFLPQQSVVELWTQAQAGVRRLAFDIPAALALLGEALFSPPPGLAVSYAAAQSARRGPRSKARDNLVSLSVDDQAQDVCISMNVSEAQQARWLAVAMKMLSSGQTLTGARIALCNERGQAQEIKTVRLGESEARFPDITPGRYLVRIERSGKIWELPLTL